ncbi:glutathione S-transferase [Sphingobium sp. BYY-5]|uniref:glutathione S-transferase n=1 Tax=Sphingobium sp. BYY-5 TaxID=2926400 RepID=UPI001FA78AC5|nr:glutathione S-transferase [Sphingobium sp. BYY-5]MCI4592488.1 glutathione S-transferase [Sphingobium sp. BYY-5]
MANYDLFYWPVPFRGQFIRAILAFAGKSWVEYSSDEIVELMQQDPSKQPVPFMGPPVLIEKATGFAIAEMPAIALYLAETLGLLPDDAQLRALTAKIVNDANDVIDELTLDGGREMWTKSKWEEFVPRLRKWMTIWEATGARHGLGKETGYLLGTDRAGVADIVTSTLWTTMADRFSVVAITLDEAAPHVASMSRRLQNEPALAQLNKASIREYGDAYCGGEIEKSLRRVAVKQR